MFRWFPFFALLLFPMYALADDYYLIEMNTPGQIVGSPPCARSFWDADAIFYNVGSQNETVSLAGVSNGEVLSTLPTSFDVPPGRATSLRQVIGIPWVPSSIPPAWIVHVTAPSSLLVDSEMMPGLTAGSTCLWPPGFVQQGGKTQLPVFRTLVAANQRQVIGGLTIGATQGHINVGVYNAGDNAATATIEVHRGCDGAITDSRTVTIEPNVMQQFTGFAVPDVAAACQPVDPSAGITRLAYVVVTVDQPSLTFASILGSIGDTFGLPTSTIQVMPGVAR